MSEEESHEEEAVAEEEEVEAEAEEVEPVHEPEKPKYHPRPQEEHEEKELTEVEQKMLEAKRKKEEEDALKMAEFEEKRRIEREKEEEELRALKEKQEQRKREREVEEKEMAERKRMDEERRQQEEQAKKQKAEEEKQRKEEEKKKKLQMMAGIMHGEGGRNFTINKAEAGTADKFEKFGNIVKAKSEMALTEDQKKAMKAKALESILKPLDLSGLDINGLRTKVKELHDRICKLEGANYDLEKRTERQAYDVKELTERQRQINRNKALKKGLDPEAVSDKHPPKIPVASKYDRQIDRRSYGDRKEMYENPKKAPPPRIFHGSARPPSQWGKKENEELEMVRRSLEGPRYQEVVKVEGARPPMEPVPVQMPPEDEEGDEDEE